jgi:glycine/D-amino acid oxidase-like deaminating enzyme
MMTTRRSTSAPGRIVVVGAGMIGASIAFHLARRGAAVTLIDAGRPGGGASAASFAWMNARDKNPRHYHDLNRRSVDMWDRFARRLGVDVGLTWGGELRWAATPEGGLQFADRVRQLQSWGYPIHLIDNATLRRLVPQLETTAISAASYTECDGHVETSLVIRACVDHVRRHGGQVLVDTPVLGLQLTDQKDRSAVRAMLTERGELPCDTVVLAGGPDTPSLAACAGLQVPLHHTFGCTIVTEPLPPVFQGAAVMHTHTDFEPQMAFRQLVDGSLMIHGGLHGGSQDRSLGQTAAEVEAVMAVAARVLPPVAEARIAEVRRGRRPVPDDGHPIIGFSQAVPNLYLATMHSGVTLAPLVGELASMEIMDATRVDLLAPYRLERFSSPSSPTSAG